MQHAGSSRKRAMPTLRTVLTASDSGDAVWLRHLPDTGTHDRGAHVRPDCPADHKAERGPNIVPDTASNPGSDHRGSHRSACDHGTNTRHCIANTAADAAAHGTDQPAVDTRPNCDADRPDDSAHCGTGLTHRDPDAPADVAANSRTDSPPCRLLCWAV
mmetsp:Transcript_20353/g.52819  ORF Transcript_20353/g.52819 Transcript_20353/m.52819 type:complete len:159 (-) Transcript_20353:2901-3377(-)